MPRARVHDAAVARFVGDDAFRGTPIDVSGFDGSAPTTLGALLDRQPRFVLDVNAEGPARVTPVSSAGEALLASARGGAVRQSIEGLVELARTRGVQLRGLALSTSQPGMWANQTLIDVAHLVRAGKLPVDAESLPPVAAVRGELARAYARVEQDVYSASGVARDGWMNLSAGTSQDYLAAIGAPGGVERTAQGRLDPVATMAHEFEHLAEHRDEVAVPDPSPELHELEEGVADLLAHQPGVQERLADSLGIAIDVAEPAADGTYPDQAAKVAARLRGAGVEGLDAMRDVLRAQPIEETPARIASELARHAVR